MFKTRSMEARSLQTLAVTNTQLSTNTLINFKLKYPFSSFYSSVLHSWHLQTLALCTVNIVESYDKSLVMFRICFFG